MRVCYNIHSHRAPAQLHRLVRTLVEGSPDCLVLVSHDRRGAALDETALRALGNVTVHHVDGGYGDFSHVRRHLDAAGWMLAQPEAADWLVNLSGQCYPLRPVASIERELAGCRVDGYLEHFRCFGPGARWPRHRARSRYLFRHRRVAPLSPAWQRRLRPLQALNFVQPLVRVHVSYGLTVGRRVRSPFRPDLDLYGGSAFMSLSRPVVEYLWRAHLERPDLVDHFRTTLSPVEAYPHTVLVNSGRFTFADDCRRYFDFRGSRFNHPRTLDASDLDRALASGAHFGRKFDFARDPDVLARLDAVVRPSCA